MSTLAQEMRELAEGKIVEVLDEFKRSDVFGQVEGAVRAIAEKGGTRATFLNGESFPKFETADDARILVEALQSEGFQASHFGFVAPDLSTPGFYVSWAPEPVAEVQAVDEEAEA